MYQYQFVNDDGELEFKQKWHHTKKNGSMRYCETMIMNNVV